MTDEHLASGPIHFAGLSADRTPLFDVQLPIPDGDSFARATPAQIASVHDFYRSELPPLNAEQAHILLCCRDFARMVIRQANDVEADRNFIDMLTVLAAVQIAATDQWREAAVDWSEQLFEDGDASPTQLTLDTFHAVRLWVLDMYLFCIKAGADV